MECLVQPAQEIECLVQPVQEIDFFLCVMPVIPHELPDDRIVLLLPHGHCHSCGTDGTGQRPLALKNTSHLGQKDARDKRARGESPCRSEWGSCHPEECILNERAVPGRTVPVDMLRGISHEDTVSRRYRCPARCRTRAAYLLQYPVD